MAATCEKKENKEAAKKLPETPCDHTTEDCPHKEPEYHLHVDADRDGVVDDDRTGIDSWNWGKGKKGAIILCNNDGDGSPTKSDNEDAKINSGNDVNEIAPFEIRKKGSAAPPADWKGVIEVSAADKDRIRIFASRSAGAAQVLGNGKGSTYQLPDLNFTKKELGIEATQYAGPGFDGEITIIFKLLKGGSVAQTETAKVRVAPWMMPNHLDSAEKVYVVDYGSNGRFRSELSTMVSAAGCTLQEHSSHDRWMQDCMEFGYGNLAPSTGFRAVMRNPRDRPLKEFARTLRTTDLGYHIQGTLTPDTTFDSTGNLECTPPVIAGGKKYPWGRAYYGPGRSGEEIDADMKEFLTKQIVQRPIEINTNWLVVGHVDEIISFVPAPGGIGFKLLLASPKRAYEILDANTAAHGGEKLLIGRTFGGVPAEITISHFLTTGLMGHSGAALRTYNNDKQSEMDSTRSKFKSECGLSDSDIIDIPALFIENHSFPPYADALTAGMVNMLVINKHCIVPKPFGPVVGGKDLFEEEVKSKLTPLGLTVKFLDDWYEYHVELGEVHCGTNTLRSPTSAPWWEFEP